MKKKILAVAITITVIAASLVTVIWAFDAGSPDDPFISLSYIDNILLPQISNYISGRLDGENVSIGDGTTTGNNRHFEVVSVSAGQQLIGESGTEFILRMGGGTVIASNLGGLSDTTIGVDLSQGVTIPMNHLLIVPRTDGRGLNITEDALVMVRGRYSIR